MQRLFILFLFFFCVQAQAQDTTSKSSEVRFLTSASDSLHQLLVDSLLRFDFVISYDLSIEAKNDKSIAETYEGALKTMYVKKNLGRLRFVSLMRTTSTYYNNSVVEKKQVAAVTKETGRPKYIYSLDSTDWRNYNAKYDNVDIEIDSSLTFTVLNRLCRKALLTYADGNKITVYFIPDTQNETVKKLEPMFGIVPGIVMQYEYHQKKKFIIFTAVSLSFENIELSSMMPPSKGYVRKKYKAE